METGGRESVVRDWYGGGTEGNCSIRIIVYSVNLVHSFTDSTSLFLTKSTLMVSIRVLIIETKSLILAEFSFLTGGTELESTVHDRSPVVLRPTPYAGEF